MKLSTHSNQKRWLFQGVAFLVSLFLITGQLLNCCHINEALGASISRIYAFTLHHELRNIEVEADEEEGHEHCHAHLSAQATVSTAEAGFTGMTRFDASLASADHCLSEQGFSAKPMVINELVITTVTPTVLWALNESVAALPYHPDSPLPQNKSSPPLYLTTRHLLI